jgi:sugar phosphate isomerase/epimerase
MQLGIFAKTFDATNPLSALQAVAGSGFSCAQFNMACAGLSPMPTVIEAPVAASIGAASSATGVSIAAVSGTYNMVHPDQAVRDRGITGLDVLASACGVIGTNLITLCTGTRDPKDQWRWHSDNCSAKTWHDLCLEMQRAIAIADKYGIFLGIEPELANVISSAVGARRLIDEMRSDRLRIVIDPANLFDVASLDEQHRLVGRALDLLADRIAIGHAKDRNADGSFATVGTGVIDFSFYIMQLRQVGFDGPVIAHGLPACKASWVSSFLRGVIDGEARRNA